MQRPRVDFRDYMINLAFSSSILPVSQKHRLSKTKYTISHESHHSLVVNYKKLFLLLV